MGKLGQLLVARGWITVQQLTRALQNQNAVGGRVGTCLLEMEVLGEELLARSLSEQLGVPAAVIEDLRGIPDEVLRLIPEKLARRCRAIPFRVAGGRLDVAMQDPRNLVCQDEIAFACGRRVKVHVLHELRIYEALQRYYREECPSRYSLLLDRLNRTRYLWGAKDAASRAAPGTPAAHVAQAASAAAAHGAGGGEERTEVLSALTDEGLLGETPRMQPPPLPEPALPPMPRRRSLFRSRAAEPPAPPAAVSGAAAEPPAKPPRPAGAATGGAADLDAPRELPPLEELDLRGEPPRPRRGQRQEKAAPAEPAGLAATGAAAAAEDGRADAAGAENAKKIAAKDAATAAPAAAAAQVQAEAAAATPAGGAGAAGAVAPAGPASGPDLEMTLPLGPRTATGTRRSAAAAAASRPASSGRREPTAERPEKVAVTDAERAELGLAAPRPAGSDLGGPLPAAAPTGDSQAAAAQGGVPEPASQAAGSAPAGAAGAPREAPATLEEVETALAATTDSEEVGRLLLGYLARGFRRVALFQAARDQITAWMARGDGIDQEAFDRYTVSFKQPSVFLNLRQGSRVHLGALAPMAAHRELALCWGGGLPRDCVVLPVRVRDRLVAVVYMDGGSRGLGGVDLEQMQRLTAAAAAAFEHCILSKKRGYAQS